MPDIAASAAGAAHHPQAPPESQAHATGDGEGVHDAAVLLQHLARSGGITPDTVAAELLRCRSAQVRAAILVMVNDRWGHAAVQRTLEAEQRLRSAPRVLTARDPDGSIDRENGSSHQLVFPDATHPARRDIDGEQAIQTDKTSDRGIAAPIRHKSWKSLAEIAESLDVQDDLGDTLHIDITYRLESRPAELGDIPETWIHTERKALLTVGSGEHAGATIVGQARVHLAPDDVLDPKAALARASVGPGHWAQIYLAEAQQYVHVHGAGGRASLSADAADNDVLAYNDPLRTMIGLRNVLKHQHVAGRGAEVAQMHAQALCLLEGAERGRIAMEREISGVRSFHDHHPARIAPVRWLASDIADWLAANKEHGRDDTEDARLLRKAHAELLRLIDDAETTNSPERDQLDDALGTPFRFVERTAEGFAEVGAMVVDAVVLGVDVLGDATGIGTFEYHPVSKFGRSIAETGDGSKVALVKIVNSFADEWSDAIERSHHGDYRRLTDISVDTLLTIDGARAGGLVAIEQVEALAGKLGRVANAARGLVGRLPTEAADIALAMADGADAFVARVRAGGLQMATAGGGDAPGPGIGGLSAETLADAGKAAGQAFDRKRLLLAKERGAKTLKRRLGTTNAPDVTEWVARVEVAFNGDANGWRRFLENLHARVTEPAPLMRKVDALLAARNLLAEDRAAVLSAILDSKIADPVAVLDDIEWVSTRQLSTQARSTLVKRAARGQVDLDWVKRTKLTDWELENLGQDNNTPWSELAAASDVPSRNRPGRLADRPLSDHGAHANRRIRGIAGELAAQEMTLPGGLKIVRRLTSDAAEPTCDFELRAPDGTPAELEAKALRPEAWKQALDEYDRALDTSTVDPRKPVPRLLNQVRTGRARGHTVYVAISDATSLRSRERLLAYLRPLGVDGERLLLIPEAAILRVGQTLREHLSIPQPRFPERISK